MARIAKIKRKTAETDIALDLNIDGKGSADIETGIAFFDHMLSLLTKHALFDLKIKAKGDLDVDWHHTVEDVGICLGEAVKKALGQKEKIRRFGWACVPMDEALASVSLDLSGRPLLVFNYPRDKSRPGVFSVGLTKEFLKALSTNAGMTMHVAVISGEDIHHINEAIFKALAKSLSNAVEIQSRAKGVPSTKGRL